jgi:hypothetical protein
MGALLQDGLADGTVGRNITLTLVFSMHPYQGPIRRPQYSLRVQSIRRVGGSCETVASLGVSCETVAGQ